MKDNRREFIKKSAAMAASVSVAGLGACAGTGISGKSKPYTRDAGIKFTELMSMHPDDPQVDVIQGISRIMNSVESFDRLLAMHPGTCNGVTLCQANFATMPDLVDIPGLIRKWGSDVINFVHFRNLRDLSGGARPSTHFTETFHDEGDLDMYEAMRAYYDIGFDGPMRPDHVPVLSTEIEAGMRGGYTTLGMLYAFGYMRGLAEAIAKENSKS